MNITLRVFLFVYAIIFIMMSLLLIGTAIDNEAMISFAREIVPISCYFPISIIISLILLVSAIFFLVFVFRTNKDKESISKFTDLGEVSISLTTIENITMALVEKFDAVRNIKILVAKLDDKVSITIRSKMLPDTDIPVTSSKIQEMAKNTVESNSGIAVADVRIVVEGIYSDNITKNKAEKKLLR